MVAAKAVDATDDPMAVATSLPDKIALVAASEALAISF